MKDYNTNNREILPAFCDKEGIVYEYPNMKPAFRTGRKFVDVNSKDLIELPLGLLGALLLVILIKMDLLILLP